MTGDEMKETYRSLVKQPITVRRYTGHGTTRTHVDTPVLGHARHYGATELVGSIRQGDQEVIVLVEDLEAAGFTLPATASDKVIVADDGITELAIEVVKPRKALDGTLVAYQFQARG